VRYIKLDPKTLIEKEQRSAAARRSEITGNFGQQQVSGYLAKHGISHEIIQHRLTKVDGKTIGKKAVIGDIFGIISNPAAGHYGRALVVEVKVEDFIKLEYSRLAKHQVEKFREWHDRGALILVAWVRLKPCVEIRFIEWGADHFFRPGVAIHWDNATSAHRIACASLGIPPNDWQALRPKAAP